MAYFQENETLIRIERDTEADVLEMLRQLDLATDKAKAELDAARTDLRTAADECRHAIESLSEEAREGLEEIQTRLGRLNYLLAEEEFDGPDKLERHSEAIMEEMENARQQIAAVELESRENLRTTYGKVETAWSRFLRSLELIRIRLRETEEEADDRFASEREILRKRLAEHPHDQENHSLAEALWEGLQEHKRWIIAFFQSPLEATPTPPPPGYASTTDKSDHGTGG